MAVARESFFWSGEFIQAGAEVPDGAPVVKAVPGLFDRAAPVVEQATAAPGEKRTTHRRSKTTDTTEV